MTLDDFKLACETVAACGRPEKTRSSLFVCKTIDEAILRGAEVIWEKKRGKAVCFDLWCRRNEYLIKPLLEKHNDT